MPLAALSGPLRVLCAAVAALAASLLLALPACAESVRAGWGEPPAHSILRLDDSAQHSLTLGFRPGNATDAEVNPPRMSWRYEPELVIPEATRPHAGLRTFRLQIASSPDFSNPEVDVRTRVNFYNELAPLPSGTWHWRVAYDGDQDAPTTWSSLRTFTVADATPKWDRSNLRASLAKLSGLERPRFGPSDGDWHAWKMRMKSSEWQRPLLRRQLEVAEAALAEDWWKGLPETDQLGEPGRLTRTQRLQFSEMARGIAAAAFAWKLTGDDRYARSRDLLLEFTRYTPGGLSSPEYSGNPHKFATEIIKHLGLAYDWLHADLSSEERTAVVQAIEWRVDRVFNHGRSWAQGDQIDPLGLSQKAGSHPYQNTLWTLGGMLCIAGDSRPADALLPMVVNWLVGVSASQGPDESYNEGHGYGTEKGGTYLEAVLALHLLAPDLNLGRNPQLTRLGDWYAHLFPVGVERLSWGDQWTPILHLKQEQMLRSLQLAWITGEARFAGRAEAFREWRFHGDWQPQQRENWLTLLASDRLTLPQPDLSSETASLLQARGGWLFAGSHKPSDWRAWNEASQLQMQARPMGKSTHSYLTDGVFIWHALGRTLASGGDNLKFANPYAGQTEAHSGLLVNGIGQNYAYDQFYEDPLHPPVIARALTWQRIGPHLHWSVDLTAAYFRTPGARRVIRHVVFLHERAFVLYDEVLAGPPDSPGNMSTSWLMKVPHRVPVDVLPDGFRFTVDSVHARVAFANATPDWSLLCLSGREGYVNPVTGKDWGPLVQKGMVALANWGQKGQMDPSADYLSDIPVWNHLWATQNASGEASSFKFMTTLLAWSGESEPTLEVLSPAAVRVSWPDGLSGTVSFDAAHPGDVWINPASAAFHSNP